MRAGKLARLESNLFAQPFLVRPKSRRYAEADVAHRVIEFERDEVDVGDGDRLR